MQSSANSGILLTLAYSGGEIVCCPQATHSYDVEFDDERSVISDCCEVLSASSGLSFLVIAFGEERWPVDMETDLAVILEQLPRVLCALRERRTTPLDFYEQGIERELVFTGDGDIVKIECNSHHPTWKADGASRSMKRTEMIGMLEKLGTDFMHFLAQACSDLASHAWLRVWHRSLEPSSVSDC